MTNCYVLALTALLGLFVSSSTLQSLSILQKTTTKHSPKRTASQPVKNTTSCKGLPTVELSDPAGDAQQGEPDIIKISFNSDGQNMLVAVELREEVAPLFAKLLATDILQVYIDTDCSDTTGGKLSGIVRKGFEYTAKLGVCITYETHGGAGELNFCGGGLKDGKIKGFSSGVHFEKYEQSGGYSTKLIGSPLGSFGSVKLPPGTVKGNRVEGAIPYTLLGVRSGQTVRIMAKEHFELAFNESSYSPDLFLMLK